MARHRMSSLPVAQFCGQAPTLGAKYGSGRAAVMSTYFHAECAGAASVPALRAKLTEEELEEVAEWHKPSDISLYDEEVFLDYASAEKELEVAIKDDGTFTHIASEAITVGHLDFAWVRKYRGVSVAFIADIKKSRWTVSGPESLQLLAYGWAFAQLVGADAFVPGIWAATEGEWDWGNWYDMTSLDMLDVWARIKQAATNDGEFATGPHCRNCFARLHCPEFLFPKSDRLDAMSVFAEGATPTSVEVADAVLAAKTMEDIAKRILENAKEYARRGNEVRSADGQVYSVRMQKGRASIDQKALWSKYPEAAKDCTKIGAPFPVATWSKT